MPDDFDTDTLLSRTLVPRIAAGPHRSDLKERLLRSMRESSPQRKSGKVKWAAAAASCVLLLAASGWGAQQLYIRYFEVEQSVEEIRIKPDGSVESIVASTVLMTDDPAMTAEEANQKWQEMRAAMATGNYLLIDVRECRPGEMIYIYSVPTDDGSPVRFGTPYRLP